MGATVASTCISCLAGTYSTTVGATVASTCISCGAGKYSLFNKARGCGGVGSSPCPVSASSVVLAWGGPASLAVDGLQNANFHTECNKANEWLSLDLESATNIASVEIHQKSDWSSSVLDRLRGAEIRVGNVNSFAGNPACASNLTGDAVITATCAATGRYVFVVQPRSDSCLHFTEIQVLEQVLFTTGASTCATVCGDGKRAGAEGCDDGNLMSGDGCSATCTVEDGFHCVGCTPTTQDICNRVNYARACGAGIQRCWIRMPTGCGQTLTETQTPTVWFLDPYGPDPASCARRVADFNGYCYKSDGQHEWRTDSPACPASQSSTDAYLNAIAERANDGYDGEGVFSSGSCTHSSHETSTPPLDATPQWWRVDMQQSVLVTALKIQGRTDCCSSRTQGYSIFVGDKEPAYLEQNSACVTSQPQLPTEGAHRITCTSPVRGRYVYFTIPTGQILTLCEVSVFGSTCT